MSRAEDWGDAPWPYPTVDDPAGWPEGAWHELTLDSPRLGRWVDGESQGQPSLLADGDDLSGFSDEDVDAVFHGNWLRFFDRHLPQ